MRNAVESPPVESDESVPRTRNPRGEGDRLRGELLDAATDLMAETGDIAKVSLRAIAARAGVGDLLAGYSGRGPISDLDLVLPDLVAPQDRQAMLEEMQALVSGEAGDREGERVGL